MDEEEIWLSDEEEDSWDDYTQDSSDPKQFSLPLIPELESGGKQLTSS
jgi:hypothetical protein